MSDSTPQEYPLPSSPWPDASGAPTPAMPGYGAPTYPPLRPGYPPTAYVPPGYAPPAPGYAPPMQAYPPVGVPVVAASSGWATASLVIGLVGLCPVLFISGIAAVVCGHVGLSEINKSGSRLQGKGLAVAGLILGYSEIALMVLFVLSRRG